eukprot:ANDGO_06774.mRNA.1 hypothetical protein
MQQPGAVRHTHVDALIVEDGADGKEHATVIHEDEYDVIEAGAGVGVHSRSAAEQAKRDAQARVLRKVNELFVTPFIQGMVSGAGHYFVRIMLKRLFQDKSYDPLS